MLRIVKVLGIAAILLSLAAGAVSASQESLPDSPLYGIKLRLSRESAGFPALRHQATV